MEKGISLGEKIDAVIDDAIRHYSLDTEFDVYRTLIPSLRRSDLNVFCWPQTWGDTSCGFGGMAGQAFTTVPTVVVNIPLINVYMVYHAFRFAYVVDLPSQEFFEDLHHMNLPGAKSNRRLKMNRELPEAHSPTKNTEQDTGKSEH